MKGTAYGVGVGPVDPELLSLTAVRLIKENDVIAVPGKVAEDSLAYKIAAGAVPEIAGKELLPIDMPMTKDREKLAAAHSKGAKLIESALDQGKNVVFLTLGDLPGTLVLMKSASRMKEVKEALKASGRSVQAVENCTLPGEKVYKTLEEIPDEAGYFSLLIAKNNG